MRFKTTVTNVAVEVSGNRKLFLLFLVAIKVAIKCTT